MQELANGAEGTLMTPDQIKEEARRLSGQSNLSNEDEKVFFFFYLKSLFFGLPSRISMIIDSNIPGEL